MPKAPKTPKAQAPQSHKKAEVSQLLSSMQASAQAKAPVFSDVLHRQLDLSHYKNEQAYPGAKYYLVGDSHNVRSGKAPAGAAKKRAGAISALFSQSNVKGHHNWHKVQAALKQTDFYESLSRFEQNWLTREPANSVLGPAYDHQGKPLAGCFAVWRLESEHQQRAQSYNYSNPKAQYSQPSQQGQHKGHKKLVASK